METLKNFLCDHSMLTNLYQRSFYLLDGRACSIPPPFATRFFYLIHMFFLILDSTK